jgi:hypothetical protein
MMARKNINDWGLVGEDGQSGIARPLLQFKHQVEVIELVKQPLRVSQRRADDAPSAPFKPVENFGQTFFLSPSSRSSPDGTFDHPFERRVIMEKPVRALQLLLGQGFSRDCISGHLKCDCLRLDKHQSRQGPASLEFVRSDWVSRLGWNIHQLLRANPRRRLSMWMLSAPVFWGGYRFFALFAGLGLALTFARIFESMASCFALLLAASFAMPLFIAESSLWRAATCFSIFLALAL